MDGKKIMQGLFTWLNIGEAYDKAEGWLLDPGIAIAAVFSRRFSDERSFDKTVDSLIFLSRKDFPSLAEREEVRFPSGKNMLRGYLYRNELSKGLVLYVHGIKGQADDYYAIGEDYFVRKGYDVFAIDLTASGRSEGMGIDGLHQSALDVKAAYEYIRSRGDFEHCPIYFFGHSWGAYGVAASLNFPNVRPCAIAAMSGFNTPLEEMLALPSSALGIPLDIGKEDLKAALKARGGEYHDLSASKGVASSGIPSLIIHGELDETVPLDWSSAYRALEDKDAAKLLLPGRGHADVFLSDASLEYAKNVRAMAKEFTDVNGKDMDAVSAERKQEFLSRFDRRMTSCVNEPLFDKIDAFFLKHR